MEVLHTSLWFAGRDKKIIHADICEQHLHTHTHDDAAHDLDTLLLLLLLKK